jgi:hypothetical protein
MSDEFLVKDIKDMLEERLKELNDMIWDPPIDRLDFHIQSEVKWIREMIDTIERS